MHLSRISIAIILVAGAATATVLGTRQEQVTSSPSPAPTAAASPTASGVPAARPATALIEVTGRIEGPLAYPAGGIPADLRVCAENLSTHQMTCTATQIKDSRFKNGVGYQLRVSAGAYQVYAIAPSFDPNYRAYYSRFVTCGYQAGCPDHAPITVTVMAGGTADNIEPGDFYRP